VRKITVAVDDETYKRARIAAAARDTSLSALVKAYLEQLASNETETERLKRQEREIRSQIAAFTVSDRLSREDLHSRSEFLDTNILLLHQPESGGIVQTRSRSR
jgi:hypothetical protein